MELTHGTLVAALRGHAESRFPDDAPAVALLKAMQNPDETTQTLYSAARRAPPDPEPIRKVMPPSRSRGIYLEAKRAIEAHWQALRASGSGITHEAAASDWWQKHPEIYSAYSAALRADMGH